MKRFADRAEAGRILAGELEAYRGRDDALVLGLPRGGVPVAYEVALALGAPLDVFVVRKLGVPGREELAMGAIASGGVRVLNEDVIAALGLDDDAIARAAASENDELTRRERLYRGERGPVEARGRTVIVVDDGLATGSTMRAAAFALRAQDPRELVVAVPVGAAETCNSLRRDVDAVVCASAPHDFYAVGLWCEDFTPTTDEQVRALLERAAEREQTVQG